MKTPVDRIPHGSNYHDVYEVIRISVARPYPFEHTPAYYRMLFCPECLTSQWYWFSPENDVSNQSDLVATQ